jgi:hypothetical protein
MAVITMTTRSFFLGLTALSLSAAGCDFGIEEAIECLDTAGYESGAPAVNSDASIRGTHAMVRPQVLAVGAEERIMLEVPVSDLEDEESVLEVEVEGDIDLLSEAEPVCADGESSYVKVTVRGIQAGKGRIKVLEAGEVVATFELGVAIPDSVEIFPLTTPFIVGEPVRVCAVARDAAGTALYVDDALSLSSTDANMSLLDPGSACRSVTPSAEGTFTIVVDGVGVTASAEFEAVAAAAE